MEVEYGRWTETWEGTFTIGEEVTRDLDRYDVEGDVVASPWFAAVAAVLLLAVVVAGWRLYRLLRRRRQQQQELGWSLEPPDGGQR